MTIIRVVDLETTGGLPPDHTVCEIGYIDVVSTATDLAGTPCDWQVQGLPGSFFVDPGRPIPPESSAIHHITDEDVAGAMSFDKGLLRLGQTPVPIDVLAAHGAKFERLWLEEPFAGIPWICTYKCALRLWPDAPAHSNQALRYWRRPEGLDRFVAHFAHRAGPDAYVTAFHLRDLLALAPLDDLIKWSSEPALQVRCHIGKWRGALWRDVDDGFLHWVSARDFDEDVLFTVRHEMDRRDREWRDSEAAEEDADERQESFARY